MFFFHVQALVIIISCFSSLASVIYNPDANIPIFDSITSSPSFLDGSLLPTSGSPSASLLRSSRSRIPRCICLVQTGWYVVPFSNIKFYAEPLCVDALGQSVIPVDLRRIPRTSGNGFAIAKDLFHVSSSIFVVPPSIGQSTERRKVGVYGHSMVSCWSWYHLSLSSNCQIPTQRLCVLITVPYHLFGLPHGEILHGWSPKFNSKSLSVFAHTSLLRRYRSKISTRWHRSWSTCCRAPVGF